MNEVKSCKLCKKQANYYIRRIGIHVCSNCSTIISQVNKRPEVVARAVNLLHKNRYFK
jgi:ribosomal protein L37AE/L43A